MVDLYTKNMLCFANMYALKSVKKCLYVNVFGSFFQIEWPLKAPEEFKIKKLFFYGTIFFIFRTLYFQRDDVRHMKPCYAMLKI